MFRQVFYSWGLAQFLHAVLMLVAVEIFWSSILFIYPLDMLSFFLFSVISSSPSLVVGWLVLKGIVNLDSIPEVKFFFWLLATMVIVILNFAVILLLSRIPVRTEYLIAPVPAILAIWISSYILYRQFMTLFVTQSMPANSENQSI